MLEIMKVLRPVRDPLNQKAISFSLGTQWTDTNGRRKMPCRLRCSPSQEIGTAGDMTATRRETLGPADLS
jgi:hypothetical protein